MSEFDDRMNEAYEIEAGRHPITDEDQALIQMAVDGIEQWYELDFHHLACAAYGHKGTYVGPNVDCKNPRACRCAEEAIQLLATLNKNDKLRTIVTVRKERPEQGGRISVAEPCFDCKDRILQFYPDALLIVPHGAISAEISFKDGQWVGLIMKLPIKIIHHRPYAVRERRALAKPVQPDHIMADYRRVGETGIRPATPEEQEWLRSQGYKFEDSKPFKPTGPSVSKPTEPTAPKQEPARVRESRARRFWASISRRLKI